MTSQPRTKSLNPRNSRPPAAKGKRKASGNSRNHGGAALERHYAAGSAELEALARAMCGENQHPVAQARIIAEGHLIRQAKRRGKFEMIEQYLAEERMSEDEYVEQIKERLIAAIFAKFVNHLPPLARMRETYSPDAIIADIVEYFDGEHLIALEQFVKEFLDKQPAKPRERDEHEALELVAAELEEFERNETRVWSRQMQAIRAFVELDRNG